MLISAAEAAMRIRSGGIAAFPTETVYGLGANALDKDAVRAIFSLKGRPSTSPLIVHVDSIEMAREQVVAEWPQLADQLAQRWWPGPLTLVLPKRPGIPDAVTAGLPTVGVRIPNHPIALEVVRTAGVPIAAPSANSFTRLSPTTAAHVEKIFGTQVGVVDGGPCQVGIESTVVAVEGNRLTLLRPGMISLEDISQIGAESTGAHPAPGMHARHYSPRTRLVLVDGPGQLPPDKSDRNDGAYIWHKQEQPAKSDDGAQVPIARSIQMPIEPAAYAAKLYKVLHELDAEGFPWIAVEAPPATREWEAIRDRLQRAAS